MRKDLSTREDGRCRGRRRRRKRGGEGRGRHRVIRYQISARPCSQGKRAASRMARVEFREEARVPATHVASTLGGVTLCQWIGVQYLGDGSGWPPLSTTNVKRSAWSLCLGRNAGGFDARFVES